MEAVSREEYKEIQQEFYQIYEEQLEIWFELLSPAKKRAVILANRERDHNEIVDQIMKTENILWS